MTTVAEALSMAMHHHGAGRLPEAEDLYRRILAVEPDNAQALALLAALAQQGGRLDVAVELNTRALAVRPDLADAHNNLGRCLHDLGRLDEAVTSYRKAIASKPGFALALTNLGDALRQTGHPTEAIDRCREALAHQPDFADAHNSLGLALQDLGMLDEAMASYRTALTLAPDFAVAHANLGNVLQRRGELEAAIASYDTALTLSPGYAEAHNDRGFALQTLGRLEAALASYRAALAHKPDFAIAHVNLGNVLKTMGHAEDDTARLDESIDCYRAALALQPDDATAHNGLGSVFAILGRQDLARHHFEQAVALNPTLASAHVNLGLTHLLAGNLTDGWREFEWRWRGLDSYVRRPYPQPWWEGQPLRGKELLIWGEQGIAEEILGLSMLPDAMALAAHCVVECDPRLVELFARSFPAASFVPAASSPAPRALAADYQTPLFGLARHLRGVATAFPRHERYLKPDPAKVERWAEWLRNLGPGPKVGLSWRGRLVDHERSRHFPPLESMALILDSPAAIFVNLQYDGLRYDGFAEDIAAMEAATGVTIHTPPGIDLTDDLDEVAAVMAGLDAVVGPATATGDLAGAVGTPTWMYAYYPASNEKEICGFGHVPWCPSIRLHTRGFGEDWTTVLTKVARDLRAFTESR